MDAEKQHIVYDLIDSFYSNCELEYDLWRIENVKKIICHVNLDDVKAIRACYISAKQDPSVF